MYVYSFFQEENRKALDWKLDNLQNGSKSLEGDIKDLKAADTILESDIVRILSKHHLKEFSLYRGPSIS